MRQVKGKIWGEGRVQVIASWTFIEDNLKQGYSISSLHRLLKTQNLITIGIWQFSRHVHKLKAQSLLPYPTLSKPRLAPSPPPRNPQQRFTETLPAKPQTFQHDPRPSKDYFAKGAGS